MPVILFPEKLTRGELLLLRRRRDDMTWYEAAEILQVPLKKYRHWEADIGNDILLATVSNVTDLEKCFIQRRRWNMTQEDLGKQLNCSRAWVNMMEKGDAPPTKIFFYWRKLDGQEPISA